MTRVTTPHVLYLTGAHRHWLHNQLAQAGAGIQRWRNRNPGWEPSGGPEGTQWCKPQDRCSPSGNQGREKADGYGHETEGPGNTGHDGTLPVLLLYFLYQKDYLSICLQPVLFLFNICFCFSDQWEGSGGDEDFTVEANGGSDRGTWLNLLYLSRGLQVSGTFLIQNDQRYQSTVFMLK